MQSYHPEEAARTHDACPLCDRFGHDHHLFEGPPRRRSGLASIFRIGRELARGYRTLGRLGPAVTVFGSAREGEQETDYALARETGYALAKRGFCVVTGGGPGIMEAANRGAREAGAHSVGCNIRLPREQRPNPFVDVMIEFDYFFVRKLMLLRYSCGFVIFPGGFGTLDELFETLTLIQTGKVSEFPLVLMGTAYWRSFLDDLRERMLGRGFVDSHDLSLLSLTDDADEAVSCIESCAVRRFGIIPQLETG